MSPLKAILLPALLACGALVLGPTSCGSAEEDVPVEILVIDDFLSGDHGEAVSRLAAEWSLGSCTIRRFDAKPPGLYPYLEALERVLRHVEASPDRHFLVNISLASATPQDDEARLIRALADRGAVVLAAVGNDGRNEAHYPAAYETAVAVAASAGGRRQPYSNFGPHVDLTVPTRDLRYRQEVARSPIETILREVVESGTSRSAPKLAGLLALVWASHPRMGREELLAEVRACCRPMPDAAFGQGLLGAGELDVFRMLWRSRSGRVRMVCLVALVVVSAAVFLRCSWRLVSGAFFALVACAATLVFWVLADLPWALRWGYFVPVAVFPVVLAGYRWVAPLRGQRVYLACDPHVAAAAWRLDKPLRRLGAAVEVLVDEPLPAPGPALVVDLSPTPSGGVRGHFHWIDGFGQLRGPGEVLVFAMDVPPRAVVRKVERMVRNAPPFQQEEEAALPIE